MARKDLRTFFILTIVLLLLGFVAVADASAPQAQNYFGDSFYFLKQQLIWGGVGMLALIAAYLTPFTFWRKFASIFFLINIILLVVVLIPGLSTKVLGARRWISFGFFSLQPSELVKFGIAAYMAKLIDLERPYLKLIIPMVLIGGLIMLQPDLGTTIVVVIICFAQLFVAKVPLISFGLTALGGLLAGFLLTIISPYRKQRLLTFLESSNHPLTSSYHIRQVLIALGSGGLFGVGLGQGRQKYLFLPEVATDSVFANIAEELGFVGAFFVLALLGFFVYKAMRIVINAPDRFSLILGTGIVSWFVAQIFLNIASMVALVPLTGVPLPFFSYGGSSLTVILFAVGVLLNISKLSGGHGKHGQAKLGESGQVNNQYAKPKRRRG